MYSSTWRSLTSRLDRAAEDTGRGLHSRCRNCGLSPRSQHQTIWASGRNENTLLGLAGVKKWFRHGAPNRRDGEAPAVVGRVQTHLKGKCGRLGDDSLAMFMSRGPERRRKMVVICPLPQVSAHLQGSPVLCGIASLKVIKRIS
ncbi:hypothetical protein AGIG_G20591 [Arapaima gigas]